MRNFLLTLLLLAPFLAQADLLDRVRLEEALRTRLEQVVQTKDAKARVLAKVEYAKFDNDLPGTSGRGRDLTPSRLELSDISKLEIDVYTELTDLDAATKKKMIEAAHVPSTRVKMAVHKIETAASVAQRAVEAKDLSDIAQRSVSDITRETRFFLGGVFAMVLFASLGFWMMARTRMKELKDQVALLANAISEGGGGGSRAAAPVATPSAYQGAGATSALGERALKDVPPKAVNELFADCYWTKNDGYAQWLWKNLDSEQRSQALAILPFMSDYSLSFVAAIPLEQAHHEHPFYVNPVSCAQLSMTDVDTAVTKDLSIWHRLSPMRQAFSAISLQAKMKAITTKPNPSFAWPTSSSAPRKLETNMDFGQISMDDEAALFETPTLAPAEMRANIRSLVWLAQRDDASIKAVLGRFDARSLATAWVGSEPVLRKLESCLPEKKLKLLRMHVERETPNRFSSVYDTLVQEGLRNEAA